MLTDPLHGGLKKNKKKFKKILDKMSDLHTFLHVMLIRLSESHVQADVSNVTKFLVKIF